MEHPRSMATNSAIAASLGPIEFDAEREIFRATYDGTRDATSLAVVAVVATVLDRAPMDLTPLESAISSDALDEMASGSSPDHDDSQSVTFCYEGFELTVFSEGSIEADPTEGA